MPISDRIRIWHKAMKICSYNGAGKILKKTQHKLHLFYFLNTSRRRIFFR